MKELGVKETFWKIFQQRTLKFGRLVGTDALGNKYYENKKDYPLGAWAAAVRCYRGNVTPLSGGNGRWVCVSEDAAPTAPPLCGVPYGAQVLLRRCAVTYDSMHGRGGPCWGAGAVWS